MAPAWRASRMELSCALKSVARGGGSSATQRGAKAMVFLQVALSLMLLSGAALLATSLARLSAESLGYRADHLLTAELTLAARPGVDADTQQRRAEAVLQQISTLPGIRSAALASTVLPLGSDVLAVAGKRFDARSAAHNVASQTVSTEYLATAQIPLLAGRSFAASDRKDTQAVAVINARLAEEYFPAGDALGRQIKLGSPEDPSAPWLTIVGIVGNVKTTNVFREMGHITAPVVYRPMAQVPGQATTLVMRTAAEPMRISEQVQEAVTSVDRDAVISNMKTMQTILHEQSTQPRFRSVLLGGFAGMALLLAALGIYGLLTQQVIRRTLEIGIRMALGANRSQIVKQIVRQGLSLTGAGIVLGIAGSLAATRVMSGLLYETSANDPWLLSAATAVFVLVALGASVVPTWRASRVDPMVSMRTE
jgi:predicted permease